MPAWVYPVVTAAASVLGSLFDQGGSSGGSETSRQTPGAMVDMPGGQDVWDQAFSVITGKGPQTNSGDFYRSKQQTLASDLQANDKGRFRLLGKADGEIAAVDKKIWAVENGQIPPEFSKNGLLLTQEDADKWDAAKPGYMAKLLRDRDFLWTQKETWFPELKGMYDTGRTGYQEPEKQPTLFDMMTEDYNSKVGASDKYLSDMTGVDKTLMDELNGVTGSYNQDLSGYKNTLNTPAFYLNMGGKNVGVVPRGTRENVGLLSDLSQAGYNAGVNKANTGYQVGSNAATRSLTQAETYTPNASAISYFKDTLLPLALKLNDTRYGIPSQTNTGNLTSTPSFLEKLSNTSNIVNPIIQMLQNSFGQNKTGANDGKTLQELYPGISINS